MEGSKKNIREVFGLDYLLGPSETDFLKTILPTATRTVLFLLDAKPQQSGNLGEMVKVTGMDSKQLLGVVDYLASQRLIQMTRLEPSDNPEFKITTQGSQFLKNLIS